MPINPVIAEDLLQLFKDTLENSTQDMRDYIDHCMKNDGDTAETSQRICILNAINELEACICGTTVDDLKLTEDDDQCRTY